MFKIFNIKFLGKDVSQTPIIIADSANEEELVNMAKQAKVIINVVGPVIFLVLFFINSNLSNLVPSLWRGCCKSCSREWSISCRYLW